MLKSTKDRILDAAEALFSKKSITETSVDDICRQISISKKTFYQIYPKKEDLIGDYIARRFEQRKEFFRKNLLGKNSIEALTVFSRFLHSKKSVLIDKKIDDELKKYYPETFAKNVKVKTSSVRDFFKGIYVSGIDDGYVKPDFEFEPTFLLFGLTVHSMSKYLSGELPFPVSNKISFRKLSDSLEAIIVNSLLTEKGMEYYNSLKVNQ